MATLVIIADLSHLSSQTKSNYLVISVRCEAAPLTFQKQRVEAAVSSRVERSPYYLREKKKKNLSEVSERDGETQCDSRAAPIR